MATDLLGEMGFWSMKESISFEELRISEDCDLKSGENVEGKAAADLLGKVRSWLLRTVFWGSAGINECFSLRGEIADRGPSTVDLGDTETWDRVGIVFSGEALLVCFAFLLRYLGRTLSSQYDCHCCAV